MSNHIDKFEKICGQMVSCGFVPEQEEKIDWFLASVHERTYEAMHAHCINLQLQGTLTFSQLIKLYTHQCFSRYPHFQVEAVVRDNLLIMLLITIIGNDNGKMTDYWINNSQWPSRFYLSK